LREGWQRKSSVERSGTEIVANDLTEFRTNCVVSRNSQNEGAPKKKYKKKSALLSQNGLILKFISRLTGELLHHKRQLQLP
jgi:hypothetical protein